MSYSFQTYFSLGLYLLSCFSYYFLVSPALSNISYNSSNQEVVSFLYGLCTAINNLVENESIIVSVPNLSNATFMARNGVLFSQGEHSALCHIKYVEISFQLLPEKIYNISLVSSSLLVKNV